MKVPGLHGDGYLHCIACDTWCMTWQVAVGQLHGSHVAGSRMDGDDGIIYLIRTITLLSSTSTISK